MDDSTPPVGSTLRPDLTSDELSDARSAWEYSRGRRPIPSQYLPAARKVAAYALACAFEHDEPAGERPLFFHPDGSKEGHAGVHGVNALHTVESLGAWVTENTRRPRDKGHGPMLSPGHSKAGDPNAPGDRQRTEDNASSVGWLIEDADDVGDWGGLFRAMAAHGAASVRWRSSNHCPNGCEKHRGGVSKWHAALPLRQPWTPPDTLTAARTRWKGELYPAARFILSVIAELTGKGFDPAVDQMLSRFYVGAPTPGHDNVSREITAVPGIGFDIEALWNALVDLGVEDAPDVRAARASAERAVDPVGAWETGDGDPPMVRAFQVAGWYRHPLPNGKHVVDCPWEFLHSPGEFPNDDTVLFPDGTLCCSHSHPEGRGKGGMTQVRDALPPAALAEFKAAWAEKLERERVKTRETRETRKAKAGCVLNAPTREFLAEVATLPPGIRAFADALVESLDESPAPKPVRPLRLVDADEAPSKDRQEVTRDGVTYASEPGRMTRTVLRERGPVTSTLANFSATIVEEAETTPLPGASPERTYALAVRVAAEEPPRRIDVTAASWSRGDWPAVLLGSRAAVASGRGAREQLREAIELLSAPKVRRRTGYTGWVQREGAWVWSDAGGELSAGGHSPEDRAGVGGHAAHYALPPPPTGDALTTALGWLVKLLAVEPQGIVLPLLGAAFRAPLGPSRGTLHLVGRHGLGKTLLARLAQSFFAPGAEPLSWADGSTANGLQSQLAWVGDAIVVVDDLRGNGTRHDPAFALADRVIRARFNGSTSAKLHRDGRARETSPPRGYLITTGEVAPQGASLLERLLCLELHARPSPDLDGLMAAAGQGALARVMSAYVHALCQRGGPPPDVREREGEAAVRAELSGSDRTRGVVAELAVGLESLAQFLRLHGITLAPATWQPVLRALAGEQGEVVRAESPALRFPELIAGALWSQRCHLAAPTGHAPGHAHLWGWQEVRVGQDTDWRPCGVRIGYLLKGTEVALIPDAALRVVRELAERQGHPWVADVHALARDLHAAGLLSRTGYDAKRTTCFARVRTGGGERDQFLVFKASTFGGAEETPGEGGAETE